MTFVVYHVEFCWRLWYCLPSRIDPVQCNIKATQHIKDGFEKGMVAGAIFIDLSAVYNTINHQKLLHKLLKITKDSPLIKLAQTMPSNRRLVVILNGKKSKWRNQKMAYPRVVF